MRRTIRCLISILTLLSLQEASAQILFAEDCFVGGVQTGGHSTLGAMIGGSFNIKWEEDYALRKAYAICYRYGRPEPHTIYLNNGPIVWNMSNQVGSEFPEENLASNYFTTHAVDITDEITINSDIVNIDLPPQTFYDFAWNWGWWGAYIVLLYESPDITSEVCTRIYIANQSQDFPQNYSFDKPDFNESNPLLFSIFSNRLSNSEIDATNIYINDQLLGKIWSADLVTPVPIGGVQGHFYYQDNMAGGLNGDTANTRVHRHDGIAIINDYLVEETNQSLDLFPASPFGFAANPHPAFLLTYTPDCEIVSEEMQGQYTICRGDSVQFAAILGYDHYAWSSAENLSDSTSVNPWCNVDSSRWYTVSMRSDGGLCPQTIPVFVEVSDVPIPRPLTVRGSSCPDTTGRITALNPKGKAPFSYRLNGEVQSSGTSESLAPGVYAFEIISSAGCRWDTTVAVPLDPFQEASFDPFPRSGFSPLTVAFANTSTQATDYQWLIDGVPISTSEDITYTFPDSGSFEVSLIAYRLEETCADTATFTLRVEPGIRVLVPNIITPNGDGRNDALVAQVQGVASCRWVIYNRWGNEVASGSESDVFQKIELWQPESEVSAGQYTVVFIAEGLAGQVEKMVFEVMVVR